MHFMLVGGDVLAQQSIHTAIRPQIHIPQPYELSQGTFISLLLERVDRDHVSGIINENIYDNFQNIAIPKGSRLFGHQVNEINDVHDVYFTQIQLSDTNQTYSLDPPLQATTPLGATGIRNFEPAAIAGTILRTDIIIPHDQ